MLSRSYSWHQGTEIGVRFLKVKKVLVCLHSVFPLLVMLIVGQLRGSILEATQSEGNEPNRSQRSPTQNTEIIMDSSM